MPRAHRLSPRHRARAALRPALFALAVFWGGLPAAAQDAGDFSGIEEIVVTAERREQRIQDLGQAITALGAEDLDRLNIEDIHDLQYQVPSLQVTGGLPRPTLRGIGQDIVAPSADPGFILHINGAYVYQIATALQGFTDMERVEVLPGPTGIEYGRATTGGSVNYIWKKARLDEREFSGDLQAGSFDSARGRAALNVPLSGNLALRVAASRVLAAKPTRAFGESGGDPLKLQNNALGAGGALRTSFHYQPTANFNADLILQWTRDTDPGAKARIAAPWPEHPAGRSTLFGGAPDYTGAVPNNGDPHTIFIDGDHNQRYETAWAQLVMEWEIGSFTLHSNSTYQYWTYDIDTDWDGSNIRAERLLLSAKDIGWSQEFSVSSNWEAPLRFLAGANIQVNNAPGVRLPIYDYQQAAAAANFVIFDAFNVNAAAGGPQVANICGPDGNQPCVFNALPENKAQFDLDADTETTLYGIFAKADWDITKTLRLSVGARYSYTERDWTDRSLFDVFTEPYDVAFNNGVVPLATTCPAGLFPAGTRPAAGVGNADPMVRLNEAACLGAYAAAVWPGLVAANLAALGGFTGDTPQAAIAAMGAALAGGNFGALSAQQAQLAGQLLPLLTNPAAAPSPLNAGNVAYLTRVGPGSLNNPPTAPGGDPNTYAPCDNPRSGVAVLGCNPQDRRSSLNLKRSWSSLDGLVRLEYRPKAGLLFYGYAATGERHGGFNWFEARPFKPEEIVAYEAGAKTEWLNRTLIVNGTAFYYDYAEKFVSTVLGNVTTTQNIGDARVMGVELSVQYQPTPSLRVNASLGWLDSEILDDYFTEDNGIRPGNENGYCPGNRAGDRHGGGPTCGNGADSAPQINLKGNPLPRSPEWSIAVGVEYSFPLRSGATVTPRLDVAWRDSYNLGQYNNLLDHQDSYTKTDLRLRYTTRGGQWYAEAYVENLEDEDSVRTQFESRTVHPQFYLAAPRIFGARVGWDFQ